MQPLVGVDGAHLPVGVAVRNDFNEVDTVLVLNLVLESLLDGLLAVTHGGGAEHGLTGDVARAGQLGQQLGDLEWETVVRRSVGPLRHTAIRRGGGLHAHEGGGSHLATGHAVDAVVDEDHGDVLSTVAGVDGLAGADGSEVAVALVGEHDLVGPHALDTRGARRSATVGGLDEVDVEVVVGHHGATHGGDADGAVVNAELFEHFGDDAVHGAVTAAGAVVERFFRQQLGFFVNQVFGLDDIL